MKRERNSQNISKIKNYFSLYFKKKKTSKKEDENILKEFIRG